MVHQRRVARILLSGFKKYKNGRIVQQILKTMILKCVVKPMTDE